MSKLLERINTRVLAIVVALLLAAVATVALNNYVQGERQDAVQAADPRAVFVAGQFIPAGTTVAAAKAQPGLLVQTTVPGTSVPAGAITDLTTVPDGLVFSIPVAEGQFIVQSALGTSVVNQEAFEVPEGLVAVAVDVTATQGVANFLDPGDRITILAHLATGGEAPASPDGEGTGGQTTTRLLLQNVEILAVGRRVTGGAPANEVVVQRDDETLTITVAVTPSDAEKLIFATLEGTVHVALLPPNVGGFDEVTTTGRNAGNLFGR